MTTHRVIDAGTNGLLATFVTLDAARAAGKRLAVDRPAGVFVLRYDEEGWTPRAHCTNGHCFTLIGCNLCGGRRGEDSEGLVCWACNGLGMIPSGEYWPDY